MTDTVGKSMQGMLIDGTTGTDVNNAGRCLTDVFSVTSATTAPPAICGTNSGQHSKLYESYESLFKVCTPIPRLI